MGSDTLIWIFANLQKNARGITEGYNQNGIKTPMKKYYTMEILQNHKNIEIILLRKIRISLKRLSHGNVPAGSSLYVVEYNCFVHSQK